MKTNPNHFATEPLQTSKMFHPERGEITEVVNIPLTKRELMAIEFTKAYIIGIHSSTTKGESTGWDTKSYAAEGLAQADALIELLNEKL